MKIPNDELWKLAKIGSILEVPICLLLHGILPQQNSKGQLSQPPYTPLFLVSLSFSSLLSESVVNGGRGNNVVMDKALRKPKITIRNWECGIICRAERLGFGGDSWHVLKQFVDIDRAAPVTELGRPWILEEN